MVNILFVGAGRRQSLVVHCKDKDREAAPCTAASLFFSRIPSFLNFLFRALYLSSIVKNYRAAVFADIRLYPHAVAWL